MGTQFQDTSALALGDRPTSFFKTTAPVIPPEIADKTREAIAVQIVNRIVEGRIFPNDRAFISTAIRAAFRRAEHRQLQQEINELLGEYSSEFRVLLDDNLAASEGTGMILLYVVEKSTGHITSGMSTVIFNMRSPMD